jgi:hypothetical protein
VEDTLQEVPEEGQQEEEDTVEDAPSVGAVAIATEALGLRGSGSHSGSYSGSYPSSELNAAFSCS